ncbi:MAG: 50S ribosomal protein L22 [Clostridia bacterium]|nr:50S ribosomal protein L22 [Clostridia bacterium]
MATKEKDRAAKKKENRDKRPRAVARYVRMSPRKVKAVLDLIRGLPVAEADAVLMGSPRGASEPVSKLLHSAIANAENNLEMAADDLYIAETYADQGPTIKRFRPRAQGRATRIRKRTSHITIILDQKSKGGQ